MKRHFFSEDGTTLLVKFARNVCANNEIDLVCGGRGSSQSLHPPDPVHADGVLPKERGRMFHWDPARSHSALWPPMDPVGQTNETPLLKFYDFEPQVRPLPKRCPRLREIPHKMSRWAILIFLGRSVGRDG